MIITIDGPTASGKSKVAQELANRLHFFCLSSGLLFRGLAYCLKNECGYNPQTISMPQDNDITHCIGSAGLISYVSDPRGPRLFLHDTDITDELKSPLIDQLASLIATQEKMRDALLEMQRIMADDKNAVVEGRDSGSVVFPHAPIKFYLTASQKVRCLRWQRDQEKKGNHFDEREAITHIQKRDTRDEQRAIAPLIVPKGAIIIDTSNLTLDETVEHMMDIIKKSGLIPAPESI